MSLREASHGSRNFYRHDRLLQEQRHDPYHARLKISEPSICPQCGAVFHKGRWCWQQAPEGAHKALCPACARIRDEFPAASLTLRGAYALAHREEIMRLAGNHEQRERAEHPLKRIMTVKDSEDAIQLSFTEAHLARDIGEALRAAYKGNLDYHYADDDIMLRVTWTRES